MVDGAGSVITTGVKGDIMLHFAATITEWEVFASPSGSIVFDLWSDTYANFPPVVGDSITTGEKPTLSSADHGQDTSLNGGAGWAITAGNIIRVNVDSASTCTRATLALKITR